MIPMAQNFRKNINFFRMQCSTGLVAVRRRARRAGSLDNDSAQMRTFAHASPLCTKSWFATKRFCGDSGEWKRECVRALMEKGTLKTVREKEIGVMC